MTNKNEIQYKKVIAENKDSAVPNFTFTATPAS